MNDKAILTLLKLLPKAALSRAVGAATRAPVPAPLHQAAARAFAKSYGIDVNEAELPLTGYPTFGDFFTRKLKPGLRPIAEGDQVVVSPVDARVAAFGQSAEGRLVQAKGRDYTLAALLDDPIDGRAFEGGAYVTLYLAPRDYHRIHAPLDGEIQGYSYIPGVLFPVNAPSVRTVPNLFCVNERLVTFLATKLGRVAVIKVGATCVGKIRAAYDDVVTNSGRQAERRAYPISIPVKKGAELGVFEMGSTVILLFEKGKVTLSSALAEGHKVRMGEAIAQG